MSVTTIATDLETKAMFDYAYFQEKIRLVKLGHKINQSQFLKLIVEKWSDDNQ